MEGHILDVLSLQGLLYFESTINWDFYSNIKNMATWLQFIVDVLTGKVLAQLKCIINI
jgi:hypothetical protein